MPYIIEYENDGTFGLQEYLQAMTPIDHQWLFGLTYLEEVDDSTWTERTVSAVFERVSPYTTDGEPFAEFVALAEGGNISTQHGQGNALAVRLDDIVKIVL